MNAEEELEQLTTEDQAIVLYNLLGQYAWDEEFKRRLQHAIEYVNNRNKPDEGRYIDYDWYADRWDTLNIVGLK